MEPNTNEETVVAAKEEVTLNEGAEVVTEANDSERVRVVHGSGSVVVEEPEVAVDITVHTP